MAATGIDGANPFADALHVLDEMLLPSAPPRYASRLAAQVALCFLCGDLLLHLGFFADSPESLFTLCGIYMVLYILHCRRRAEALWFFRLQKPADTMARGRLILITTPVLTLMAMAMSLILAASRWLIWKTYFGREYLYNYIAVAYGAYVLGFLEAWFYSFRNLEVTLSIRQRFQERESPLCKPWLQNLLLVAVPICWTMVLLAVALLENNAQKRLIDAARLIGPVVESIGQALSEKQAPSVESIERLTSLQASLATETARADKFLYVICALAGTACLAIFAASAYSFVLIIAIQRQLQSSSARWTAAETPMADDLMGPGIGSFPLMTPTPDRNPVNHDELALKRLARDLSIAVPGLGMLALIYGSGSVYVSVIGVRPVSPRVREFLYDAFPWSTTLVGIVVMATYIYNLVNAWGQGRATDGNALASITQTPITLEMDSIDKADLD